jgi:hypothetical protein
MMAVSSGEQRVSAALKHLASQENVRSFVFDTERDEHWKRVYFKNRALSD